jgi:hypothetical protein
MAFPKTYREKLEQDLEQLWKIRESLYTAILELSAGQMTASYSLGNRSVTKSRASLGDMKKGLREIEAQIEEILAILNGRPIRNTATYTYLSPSFCIPPFLG